MTTSARAEKDSCQLNRRRGSYRTSQGRRFSRAKIFKEGIGQTLILLSLDKLRLAKFYAQGLVSVLAQGLVSFMFSWSEVELALVSDPRCVFFSGPFQPFGSSFRARACFFHWLWLQGQSVFLWPWFQGQGGFLWMALLPYNFHLFLY